MSANYVISRTEAEMWFLQCRLCFRESVEEWYEIARLLLPFMSMQRFMRELADKRVQIIPRFWSH